MVQKKELVEAEVGEDNTYLFCPTCRHFDIQAYEEQCPKCGQEFSWEWLNKLKKVEEKHNV